MLYSINDCESSFRLEIPCLFFLKSCFWFTSPCKPISGQDGHQLSFRHSVIPSIRQLNIFQLLMSEMDLKTNHFFKNQFPLFCIGNSSPLFSFIRSKLTLNWCFRTLVVKFYRRWMQQFFIPNSRYQQEIKLF